MPQSVDFTDQATGVIVGILYRGNLGGAVATRYPDQLPVQVVLVLRHPPRRIGLGQEIISKVVRKARRRAIGIGYQLQAVQKVIFEGRPPFERIDHRRPVAGRVILKMRLLTQCIDVGDEIAHLIVLVSGDLLLRIDHAHHASQHIVIVVRRAS